MRFLHVTEKEHLKTMLKDGLKPQPKRIRWTDTDGSVLEDRIAPASECPPAIYAYPLLEDQQARYNSWVKNDDDRTADSETCGILFEPNHWLCIGTWAFGADFVTRKRPITSGDFEDEVNLLAQIAGSLLGAPQPSFYDVICEYDFFTEENFKKLMAEVNLPKTIHDLFKSQFCQLAAIYRPKFEVCVMEDDVKPSQIVGWVDLGGVTDNEAWYDDGLTNKRLHHL